jgi:8-oxo-dGTP pyrophosphatase MutT (NUDIX family)
VSAFEPIDTEITYTGRFLRAGVERYRHADGQIVAREKVWHPGAVGMVAIDSEHVWLTRQPREVAGLTASLEVPAGKFDVPGELPLETARRELAEEIGKQAANWEEIGVFFPSPGFSDERVWLYLATDLSDVPGGATPDTDERIEIVPWPLSRIGAAIAESQDAKTRLGLYWLADRLRDAS